MTGFLVSLLVVVYFLPMLIAYGQERRDAGRIAAINLLLGWTLVGWLVALLQACSTPRRRG